MSEHLEQGLAALRSGNAAAAVEHLQTATREDNASGQAWGALGVALCQAGQPTEGASALERAVTLAPGHAGMRHNLGKAFEAAKQPERALEAYRQALAIEPTYALSSQAIQRLEAAVTPPPVAAPSEFHLPGDQPASYVQAPVVVPTRHQPPPHAPVGQPYAQHASPQQWSGASHGAAPYHPHATLPSSVQAAIAMPPPRKRESNAGLWIGLALFLVVGFIGAAVVATAVLLPVVAQAREAARRERDRRIGFPSPTSTSLRFGRPNVPTYQPSFPRTEFPSGRGRSAPFGSGASGSPGFGAPDQPVTLSINAPGEPGFSKSLPTEPGFSNSLPTEPPGSRYGSPGFGGPSIPELPTQLGPGTFGPGDIGPSGAGAPPFPRLQRRFGPPGPRLGPGGSGGPYGTERSGFSNGPLVAPSAPPSVSPPF